MALRLTLGFSDNPRVQPLKDGIVKPQGIELDCRGQGQRLVNGRTKALSHGGALGLDTDGPAGVTQWAPTTAITTTPPISMACAI